MEGCEIMTDTTYLQVSIMVFYTTGILMCNEQPDWKKCSKQS